jgi:hypothetical protein
MKRRFSPRRRLQHDAQKTAEQQLQQHDRVVTEVSNTLPPTDHFVFAIARQAQPAAFFQPPKHLEGSSPEETRGRGAATAAVTAAAAATPIPVAAAAAATLDKPSLLVKQRLVG